MASHKSPLVLFIISWRQKQDVSKKQINKDKGAKKVLLGSFMSAIKPNVPLMEMVDS